MAEPLALAAEALAPEDDLAPTAEMGALTMDPLALSSTVNLAGHQRARCPSQEA